MYAEGKSILLQEVGKHKLVTGGWHRVLFDLGWGPCLNYLEPDISIIIIFGCKSAFCGAFTLGENQSTLPGKRRN